MHRKKNGLPKLALKGDPPISDLGNGQTPRSELVSVIIPCYNQAIYLNDAIESILRQTYTYYEIIIVDDGSTDNTYDVAATYPCVRCIRQVNQGLSAARNTGWRASKGEYLVFLDGDDRLCQIALEAGLESLQAEADCAFTSGHFCYINRDGSLRNRNNQAPAENDHYLSLLQGNYIGMHATVMYRRSVLETVKGFNTTLRACEDYDLYLRIAKQYPITRHTTPVAEYRRHGSNMSGDPQLMLRSVLGVLKMHRPTGKDASLENQAYKAGKKAWQDHYGEKLVQQASNLKAAGNYSQAYLKMLALLRYAPRHFSKHVYRQSLRFGGKMPGFALLVSFRRKLWRGCGQPFSPPVGHAQLGDLRRLTPLCREFGYTRGLPVDRYYIEKFLADQATYISGRVLEIGDNSYTRRFGGDQVMISDVLHVSENNPNANYVGDLTGADNLPSNAFDCVLVTQTLQLIYDVRLALKTIYRILKPVGVLLATMPGISQISIDEWADSWYWSFTVLSVQRLLKEVFPASNVTVDAFGNVLAATAFLNGLAAEELRPDELDHCDPHYQMLIAARAMKPK